MDIQLTMTRLIMSQVTRQAQNSLTVHQLTIMRGYRTLVEDLSFVLEPGQIMHIQGNNGCGKTSLLYVLTGMRAAEAGRISWAGRDISHNLAHYQRALCFIGHENAIKLELTVAENLRQFYAWQDCRARPAQDVLATLGLAEFQEAPCHQLSAGQRRRLSLGRLLLTQASLWLLDEPFTALDQASIELFQTLFAEHAARGGMIILTSHQPVAWRGCEVMDFSLQDVAA